MNSEVLYIVVPCYNEEEVLPETSKRLKEKRKALIEAGVIGEKSRILFVDDGSKDKTWLLIQEFCANDTCFSGLKLAHNRGHQNALLAGLMTAKEYADIVISMDADLQDDIEAMDAFIEKYHAGNDIVYGVRSSRKKDSFFKRSTALAYYRFLQKMGVDIIYNHADYRLMSRRALEALADFKEVNLFLRMITALGFLIFAFSLIMLIYSIVIKITGHADSGWASLICSIWMIGGIQLLSLGIIGEYIGKIYNETKARPRYIIEEFINRVE